MELFYLVEGFTQIITYVMILSGIPPCLYMVRTGSTKGFPYPFFLTNMVNACLGIGYGLLLNNRPLIQINTVAAFCVGIYLLSFVYVSQSKARLPNVQMLNRWLSEKNYSSVVRLRFQEAKKGRPLSLLFSCCLVLWSIYFYLTRVVEPEKLVDNLGVALLTVSSVLLLTPLIQVKLCIEEKSARDLSLSMLIAGTLCTSAWLTYGYLLKDINIYFPNILGLSVNICQFGAIVFYGRQPKPEDVKTM